MSSQDYVSVLRVIPHPGNIRDDVGDVTELAASIRAHGILQPLVVRPHPQKAGWFVILAGHRRFAAAKAAGLDEVPVVITHGAGAARDLEVMLVENVQRRDLSPVEKAEAMGKLRQRGYTPTRISRATGLSLSTVGYYLSLLDLDEHTRARVAAGAVPVGEAITAVRQSRAATRAATGQRPRGRPAVTVQAHHFGWTHDLAGQARNRCRAATHDGGTPRKLPGGVACGGCWEATIRADQDECAAAAGERRAAS